MTLASSDQGYLHGRHRYVRPPQPLFFPVDEEMPETRWHLEVRTALFQLLRAAFGHLAVVGSEQFVFWDPTDPKKRCAPDVMVRLGEADAPFRSWKIWERGAPQLAVELISDSDASDLPWSAKLERYRHVGLKELVRFDPEDAEQALRIWDAVEGDLVERAQDGPAFSRCEPLAAFWCVKPDERLGLTLRLAKDAAGEDLYPTPDEERLRAEARVRELEAELAALKSAR